MNKKRTVKRVISRIVFTGLLISLLPATLQARVQQLPREQQGFSGVQPKLSKEEVKRKITKIRKTVKHLKIANAVIGTIIAAIGLIAFIVVAASGGFLAYKKLKPIQIIDFPTATEVIKEELFGKVIKKPIKIKKHKLQLPAAMITLVVAGLTFVSAPIAFLLLNIGLTGITLSTAFAMAGELEQMEKRGQITLTMDQKRTLAQLKNMTKDPITRGLIKYFALKKALHDVVKNTMDNNPELISTIAFGQPKKAHKIIAQYIKLKWRRENSKKAIAQLAKETTPHLQRAHKKAVAQLQKIEQKIAKLEGKHAYLVKSPELKDGVQEFGQKANHILEGLKKPMLKKKKPKPAVVPL